MMVVEGINVPIYRGSEGLPYIGGAQWLCIYDDIAIVVVVVFVSLYTYTLYILHTHGLVILPFFKKNFSSSYIYCIRNSFCFSELQTEMKEWFVQ